MATDDPAVTRARLVPWQGNTLLDAKAISVAFNPVSLKLALSNQIKADAGNKGKAQSAAQFVDKSASTLSFELIFDTSLDYSDVREQTRRIAELFMKPVAPGEPGYQGDGKQPTVPRRLRFQWGKFGFDGLMQSYAETLDYFSPDGVLLLKQKRVDAEKAASVVARLRPDQRKVLRMGLLEGMTHSEIARATGMPLGTVKTQMRRGLIQVRQWMGLAAPRLEPAPT